MKTNMGSTDRTIRSFIAIAMIAMAMRGTIAGTWAIVAYIVAAVFLLTSLVSFCPLYAVFGMSSRPTK